MNRISPFLLPLLVVAFGGLVTSGLADDDWTQFRGQGGRSVAPGSVPKTFDEETNVAWKVPLPGKGASGPIVVGKRVIATCSGGEKQDQLYVVCLDTESGQELWRQEFWATGRCYVHPLSANAAPTPASDGQRIYAFFSSNDLACLDLDGNLLWYRGLAVDFPKAGNDVGMASSPIVRDGVVVVQVECQGDSFAMALDAEDGTTIWTQPRPRVGVWSSPLVAQANDRNFVMLQSKDHFDVLDLKSGELVYQVKGEVSSVSSAAFSQGRLFVPINGTTAFAISDDGSLTEEWNSPQMRPSSMSAVVDGQRVYTLNRAGGLFVYNAADGQPQGRARVIKGAAVWATPVIVDDHLYCFSQDGKSYVVNLATGGDPEVVHEYEFKDEVFLGSPAVADNAMYIRSDRFLWKIAE